MTSGTVYLVEDHTTDSPDKVYWAKVYVSPSKARSGVEYWARRNGLGRLRWEDGGFGAMLAYRDGGESGGAAYTVVPLGVHRDDEPEEP